LSDEIRRELERRIGAGTARVGILGLGYVGLPLSMEFVRAGLSVTGFDEPFGFMDSRNATRGIASEMILKL